MLPKQTVMHDRIRLLSRAIFEFSKRVREIDSSEVPLNMKTFLFYREAEVHMRPERPPDGFPAVTICDLKTSRWYMFRMELNGPALYDIVQPLFSFPCEMGTWAGVMPGPSFSLNLGDSHYARN